MSSWNDKKNKKKKYYTKPEIYNDQLGENASEEFDSEAYSNASKANKKKK